jgi:hypothetical protein
MAITVLVMAAGASLLHGGRYGPAPEPAIEVAAGIAGEATRYPAPLNRPAALGDSIVRHHRDEI